MTKHSEETTEEQVSETAPVIAPKIEMPSQQIRLITEMLRDDSTLETYTEKTHPSATEIRLAKFTRLPDEEVFWVEQIADISEISGDLAKRQPFFLRNDSIEFKDTAKGTSTILAFTEQSGIGEMVGGKFLPLKPGTYKVGTIDGVVRIDPLENTDSLDDLALESHLGGSRRYATYLMTIHGTDNPSCSFEQLAYYYKFSDAYLLPDKFTESQLQPNSADISINIHPNEKTTKMSKEEKERLIAAQNRVDALLSVQTTEKEKKLKKEQSPETALMKELSDTCKASVEMVEDGENVTGFVISNLTKTELTMLVGLEQKGQVISGSGPNYKWREAGLRFGSTIVDGEVVKSDLSFESKNGLPQVPDTLAFGYKVHTEGNMFVTVANDETRYGYSLDLSIDKENYDHYKVTFRFNQAGSAEQVDSILSAAAKSLKKAKLK